VAGLGCFPNPKRPRVIWAGLRGEVKELEALKNQLEPGLVKLGYIPEKREFHPHLTLGRVKEMSPRDRQELATAVEQLRDTDYGDWKIERIDLMQSQLAQSGARYTVLRSFPLAF
jgi:2'-5' RNA ligase